MTDLFISEYIEGSSNNKALEFYNGTGAAIDLAAEQYVVQMYFNGNTTAGTTINLTGTIAPGDVFVLANASANTTILAEADQTNSTTWYNGDDAIVLRKGGATGTIVDSIGQVGVDPGSEWGSGLTSTGDNTLRRKSTIAAGDTNPSDAFNPSAEWDGFAQDTFDGLGSHTLSGGGGSGVPVIAIAAQDAAAAEAGQDPGMFRITRTGDTTNALTVNYTIGGTATNSTDYSNLTGSATIAAGQSFVDVTITPVDDASVEGNETVTLTLIDTADYDLGASSSADVAIADNDTAGVTIAQSGGTTTLTEGGETDTYTVVLTSQPTADVTINLNPDSQSTTNPTSLVFTPANWNVAQTVTVTAVDDVLDEGNHSGSISHSASSADSNYNGITVDTVMPAIADNDSAGFTLSKTSASVSETGTSDTFTIVLTSQPTSDVVLSVVSSDTNEVAANSPTLTFTSANWNLPQMVTLSGVNDTALDGNQQSTITVGVVVAQSDSAFGSLENQTIIVTTTDDESSNRETPGHATSERWTTPLNDRLSGTEAGDRIFALSGHDHVNGMGGDDQLFGGNGRDQLRGGSGQDNLFGNAHRDHLFGENGHDWLWGRRGNDLLHGGDGNDHLFGGVGRDRLKGGDGRDRLNGGAGSDQMNGNHGNDVMITGAGRDRIVIQPEHGFDRVEDFTDGLDRIVLRGIRFADLSIQQDDNGVLISYNNQQLLLLKHIAVKQITQTDFL